MDITNKFKETFHSHSIFMASLIHLLNQPLSSKNGDRDLIVSNSVPKKPSMHHWNIQKEIHGSLPIPFYINPLKNADTWSRFINYCIQIDKIKLQTLTRYFKDYTASSTRLLESNRQGNGITIKLDSNLSISSILMHSLNDLWLKHLVKVYYNHPDKLSVATFTFDIDKELEKVELQTMFIAFSLITRDGDGWDLYDEMGNVHRSLSSESSVYRFVYEWILNTTHSL